MLALLAALLLSTSSGQACSGRGAGGVCLAQASPAEQPAGKQEVSSTGTSHLVQQWLMLWQHW
jgi:hypothetical protein